MHRRCKESPSYPEGVIAYGLPLAKESERTDGLPLAKVPLYPVHQRCIGVRGDRLSPLVKDSEAKKG